MKRKEWFTQTVGASQRSASNAPLHTRGLSRYLGAVCAVTASVLLLGGVILAGPSIAGAVEFKITDEPGRWFKNTEGAIGGTHSLAVVRPGDRIKFSHGSSNTVHTATSLIFPTGAARMPFDTEVDDGGFDLTVSTPGLYVFYCKIHPYMFAAVIVDDPQTTGLDLGNSITLVNGITVPTSSDLATRLLRTFFITTNPANWQNHAVTTPWHVTYPDVDVRVDIGVVNLPAVLNARYGNDIVLPPSTLPATPGVGEVWVNAQFELTAGKRKPGTATKLDATTWQVSRKVALPQINMNNPHNMWTDRDQTLIYQTQWFDNKLTVFDRKTGRLVRNIKVGEAPAHVMTRVDTDQVHVTLNGEDSTESVVELAPLASSVERRLNIGRPNPHGHWMSHTGHLMVTPNPFTADSTLYDFPSNSVVANVPTGAFPIAIGMMPDSSKSYTANLLDSTITVVDMATGSALKTINLLAHYNPLTGAITGPVGGLPIQTPVSPNGRYMVTANTLTATLVVVDTATDEVVAMLPCDPGCHGVQFGAKQGGGYYAYVSSKFSNSLIIIDPDPNLDGNPADAHIAGRVLLTAAPSTVSDDVVTGNPGMGGQGILTIPVVYNGWVQNLPSAWKAPLTGDQLQPLQ